MGKTKRKHAPIPLLPPPLKSRKKARQITTQFHKLNNALDDADDEETKNSIKSSLDDLGGRAKYQEASQLSTSFFSTSKWVIGRMQSLDILRGIPTKSSKSRRPTKLLEIGAINTTLLDLRAQQSANVTPRAIDLRSSVAGVEAIDYMLFPPEEEFDVIVNSMVINSVPSPVTRGAMLQKMYSQLEEGGYLFLMLPLLCINNSKHLTKSMFVEMVTRGVGFQEVLRKESPKIFFIVLRKVGGGDGRIDGKWKNEGRIVNRGKKFRNTFDIVFCTSDE